MNAPIDWRNSATMSTIDVSPTEALVAQSFHRGRLSIVDEHSRRCAHIEDLRKGPLPVARGTTRNHMEYLRTWDDIRVDPERFYLLRLVTNGSVRISHDDQDEHYAAGNVVVTKSWLPTHEWIAPDEQGVHSAVFLKVPDHVIERAQDIRDCTNRKLDGNSAHYQMAAHLFGALPTLSLNMTDAAFRHFCLSIIAELSSLCSASRSGTAGMRASSKTRFHDIQADLDLNFSEIDYSLAELARNCGVSSRLISMVLHEHGTTFHREVMKRRMDQAQTMLLCRAMQIKDIAFRCGFKSHSHFCAAFKREVGCTPAEYAHSRRASAHVRELTH